MLTTRPVRIVVQRVGGRVVDYPMRSICRHASSTNEEAGTGQGTWRIEGRKHVIAQLDLVLTSREVRNRIHTGLDPSVIDSSRIRRRERGVETENVAAATAGQDVVASATGQGVVPGLGGNEVVARIAGTAEVDGVVRVRGCRIGLEVEVFDVVCQRVGKTGIDCIVERTGRTDDVLREVGVTDNDLVCGTARCGTFGNRVARRINVVGVVAVAAIHRIGTTVTVEGIVAFAAVQAVR